MTTIHFETGNPNYVLFQNSKDGLWLCWRLKSVRCDSSIRWSAIESNNVPSATVNFDLWPSPSNLSYKHSVKIFRTKVICFKRYCPDTRAHTYTQPSTLPAPLKRSLTSMSVLFVGRNVRWPHRMLPPGESRWVSRRERQTDGQTDGRQ